MHSKIILKSIKNKDGCHYNLLKKLILINNSYLKNQLQLFLNDAINYSKDFNIIIFIFLLRNPTKNVFNVDDKMIFEHEINTSLFLSCYILKYIT